MTGVEAAETPITSPLPHVSSSFRRSGVLVTFPEPVPYSGGWALQQQCHVERLSGTRADTLLLLEHLPVYTAGRATRPSHLRPEMTSFDDPPVPIETVNRGGSVTYHGPGQLVAYPIVMLSQYAPGAKAYVHMLEEVVIRTLIRFGLHGYRVAKKPGIWLSDRKGQAKIASIGARIDRGITLHGLALNVANDLRPFSNIVPCGLDGCRVTSLEVSLGAPVSMPQVLEHMASEFSAVFRLEWTVRISDGLRTTAADGQPVAATGYR
jgi:lipoyl(octanoyl) transferase